MNSRPGTSGTGRRLMRCGVLLWGLRGADEPEYNVSAPLQG
jgi:hypothetical protein